MPSFKQRVSAAVAAWKTGKPSIRMPKPISLAALHRAEMARIQKRSYAGAQYDRLTEDFLAPLTTGDAEMRTRIRTLRQRARELERNEPYSRRFLSRMEDNVYDHHGMTFSSLAGQWARKNGRLVWQIDDADKRAIEVAFDEWKKNPFVTDDMTLNEGGRLTLRSMARDGDVFVKWVVDPSINKFGFALQLLEADMCDDYKNDLQRDLAGKVGAQVRMGVEVDRFYRATNYWILKDHPGDQQWWNAQGYWSERHPAAEFLHPFHRTRITQCRDVTWLCGIMRDLKMLDGYDEAAIVAARTGAAKMGFLTRDYNEAGPPMTGDEQSDDTMDGDKAMDAEAGLIEDMSQTPGLKFQGWDPAYPHEQYEPFIKTRLRRISAGLDMSYYAVANDLTDVNFSSIRAGLLEDRERFKSWQTSWISKFETPVFLKFVEIGLLTGTITEPLSGAALPFSKLEKFKKHKFRPRRWPWVDPEKDVSADEKAVNNRFKSRAQVIEEHSETTFSDVIAEHEMEQAEAEAAGVELPPVEGAMPEKAVDETEETANKPKAKKAA
jgi:lambda family phage portal protein